MEKLPDLKDALAKEGDAFYVYVNEHTVRGYQKASEWERSRGRGGKLSTDTAERMAAFGLGAEDLDQDGLITLYHGGRELPDRLRPDEIFFMAPSLEVAQDYARMRKGGVFTLRVDPEVVSWNTGSQEVEFDRGGLIREGVIVASPVRPAFEARAEATAETIRGIGVGAVLPRTGWVVEDLVTEPHPQFLLCGAWHAAHVVLAYEFPGGLPGDSAAEGGPATANGVGGVESCGGLRAAALGQEVLRDQYLAFNLSDASRESLMQAFPPKFKRVICHHITLAFEPTSEAVEAMTEGFRGKKLRVVGYAADPSLECFLVEVDGTTVRPDGAAFHITHSVAPPRQARDSKAFLASGPEIQPLDLLIEGEVSLNEA